MKVYRCCVEEGDHIGLAALGARVLITVTEHGTNDEGSPATERELTALQARTVADRLRALQIDGGKSGDVYGVWVGEAADDRGYLICLQADNGSSRSVILSPDDTAEFCAELNTAAQATDTGPIPLQRADDHPVMEHMTRRAAALRIVAAVFDAEVNLYDAADWVAEIPPVESGPTITEEAGG